MLWYIIVNRQIRIFASNVCVCSNNAVQPVGKTAEQPLNFTAVIMDYNFEDVGNVLKVSLSGRLVASCSKEFKDTMFDRMKDSKAVLFNLQKMEHIDSSGLGALVSILQFQNSNSGTVKLCCLQPGPKIVFDITKVGRIFSIYDTEEAAMAAFSNPT